MCAAGGKIQKRPHAGRIRKTYTHTQHKQRDRTEAREVYEIYDEF